MPWFSRKYYHEEDTPTGYRNLESGYALLMHNPLFQQLDGTILTKASHLNEKGSIACVFKNGTIHVNTNIILSPEQWYYVLAHNLLHLAFGHFDQDHIPPHLEFIPELWNKACDIYIIRFLYDIRLGDPICTDPASDYPIKLNDEQKIYEYLLTHDDSAKQMQKSRKI